MAELLTVCAPALAVLSIVRIVLKLLPPPGMKPDDPAKLGHPMAGPASLKAAHFALSRQRPANRPKFRT
jgi:hypothetical protein